MMEKFLKPTALEFIEAGEKTMMVAAIITVFGILFLLIGTIICLWKLVQKMSKYQVKKMKKLSQVYSAQLSQKTSHLAEKYLAELS